jgi:4-hydroxybenzoate polyprenyltransferase
VTALPPAIALLRPQQWVKNALVFAALLFARKLFDPSALGHALLAFACFCAGASSVYVLNDLVDVERDRLHPEKRKRPIASGAVSRGLAGAIAAGLTAGCLALAFLGVSRPFGLALLSYLAMSHFYSFAGKHIAILDVMLIASGFVVRALSGALAIAVPISNWFMLTTVFVSLFIALSKRKAEMLALSEDAVRTRPVLRAYTKDALSVFTAASLAGVLMSYALYLLDLRHLSSTSFNLLALTLPFVMFAVFRYHLLVETANLGERAEEVLFSDRAIQVSVLGFGLVSLAALYWT